MKKAVMFLFLLLVPVVGLNVFVGCSPGSTNSDAAAHDHDHSDHDHADHEGHEHDDHSDHNHTTDKK